MKRNTVGLVHIGFKNTLATLEFVGLQALMAWIFA
jgi:energy-converting hydrogenase Eha subunit E